MGKIVLFSPVGGTDPMPESNDHDGSMIHITRVYKPDKIVLYMSKEIIDNHNMDNRYLYCIKELGKLQNRNIEVELIERPELIDVQKFDYFYRDFSEIICAILNDLEDEDTFLLNVSSGTPAMKSALFVLATLGEYRCKYIQVSTPSKGMNEHIHDKYNYLVKERWELNEDNQSDFIDRCEEIISPELMRIRNEEIIKKHIKEFDYQGALSVVSSMRKEDTRVYQPLLRLAYSRLLLDSRDTDIYMKETGVSVLPIMEGNKRSTFEYALALDVKRKRQEYGDFVRAITPLIFDLFDRILKRNTDFDLNHFITISKKGKSWNIEKLQETKYWKILTDKYSLGFSAKMVVSDHLCTIMIKLLDDADLISLIKEVREIEVKIRNIAAHEITCITDSVIEKKTGCNSFSIMKKIQKLFTYSDIIVRQEYWNSYEEMNQLIIKNFTRKR